MNKIKKTARASVAGASLFLIYTAILWENVRLNGPDDWLEFTGYLFFFIAVAVLAYWSIYAIYKAGTYWLEEYKTNREHKALLRTKELFNAGILSKDEYQERLARIKAR